MIKKRRHFRHPCAISILIIFFAFHTRRFDMRQCRWQSGKHSIRISSVTSNQKRRCSNMAMMANRRRRFSLLLSSSSFPHNRNVNAQLERVGKAQLFVQTPIFFCRIIIERVFVLQVIWVINEWLFSL